MTEFTIEASFNAPRERVFTAWLNSKAHSAMIGSVATASKKVGKPFSAFEGYISGTNAVIEKPNRIVQNWRTQQFLEG
jgi:uncharacterized protein YndB with AHSA1/START domain